MRHPAFCGYFHFIVFLKPVLFLKSLLYKARFFFGAFKEAFLLIPFKAPFPTFFREVDFMMIVFNLRHPLKAFLPMVFTFLPIITFLSFAFR